MKYLNQEIENELKNQGAELIRFVSAAGAAKPFGSKRQGNF